MSCPKIPLPPKHVNMLHFVTTKRMRNSAFILVVLVLATASGAQTVQTQSPDSKSNHAKSVRAKLFLQAKDYQFESRAKADKPVKLSLCDRSLLNWTNPLRAADLGIIALWEDEGLPLAIGTIYTIGPRYVHSLTSLSEYPLHANYQGKPAWTPSPGVKWHEWKAKPKSIAISEALRKVQMRAIARQFEFQLKNGTRAKSLRLMPEPLHRFKSKKHGVLDGAVLAFAEGNDAEAVMILRADETDETWKYAFARAGYFEMTGSLKGKQVWKVNHVRSANAGTRQYIDSPYVSSSVPVSDATAVWFDGGE